MVIEFDPEKWWQPPLDMRGLRDAGRPEWHALRARLLTAHEALRAFGSASALASHDPSGSFAHDAARALDAIRGGLAAVNPIDSGNSKPARPIEDDRAGESRTGDRG